MIQMFPVKLASTGKHLFDLPYCYAESLSIEDATLSRGRDAYYANRDLSRAERNRIADMIAELNAEQERIWNVNQPAKP